MKKLKKNGKTKAIELMWIIVSGIIQNGIEAKRNKWIVLAAVFVL